MTPVRSRGALIALRKATYSSSSRSVWRCPRCSLTYFRTHISGAGGCKPAGSIAYDVGVVVKCVSPGTIPKTYYLVRTGLLRRWRVPSARSWHTLERHRIRRWVQQGVRARCRSISPWYVRLSVLREVVAPGCRFQDHMSRVNGEGPFFVGR